MSKSYKTRDQLLEELQDLKSRMAETEETLRAILTGEVDGLVVNTAEGERLFTLSGADLPYRVMVETMNEGAVTLAADRTILFCNQQFANITRSPLEKVIGTSIYRYISPSDLQQFDALTEQGLNGDSKIELNLTTEGGYPTPVLLSISPLDHKDTPGAMCLIVTDLTEQKRNEEILAEEKLTTQILKQTTEILALCNHEGRIIRASRSAERILGRSPILEAFDQAFNLHYPNKKSFDIQSVINGKSINGVEVTLKHSDNKIYSFLLSANSFITRQGFNGIVVVMVDITGRKRAEEETSKALETVRRNEEQFRVLVQNLRSGVALIDEAGKFVVVNPEFLHMFGLDSESDILNVNSQDWSRWEVYGEDGKLLHVDDHPVRKAAITGKSVKSQLVPVRNPGANELTWMLVNAEPILKEDGSVHRVICTYHDITERKLAEEMLRESEQRLALATSATQIGMFEWNLRSSSVLWTQTHDAIFGYSPAMSTTTTATTTKEYEYHRWSDRVHPEDLQRVNEETHRCMLNHKPFEVQHRIIWPDGSFHWVEARGVFTYDSSGSADRMLGVVMDITERKQAEEVIRESEARFRAVLDNSLDVIYRLNLQTGRYDYISPSVEKISGYTVDELMAQDGETAIFMIHPDDLFKVRTAYARMEKNGESAVEYRQQTKSGEYRWLSSHLSLTRDNAGMPLYRNGNIRDITERKRTEYALKKSEERFKLLSETAEELIKWKDIRTVIKDLCLKTMTHLDSQMFFNFTSNEKTGMLHLNTFAGVSNNDAMKVMSLNYGEGFCGCAARDKAPVVAENISAAPDPRTELILTYGIRAYACFPLMVRDKVIGTLAFGTRTRTHFSEEDMVLMKRVANQVATATERTRLIDELQQSRDELEVKVQERTAELEKTVEALRQSNISLEDFAHVASHDLQEPLRKIRTFGDRLANMKTESMNDMERDYLARMQQSAERMQGLINDLLKYSRVTSSPESFKVINLNGPVQEAVGDLSLVLEETEGRVDVGELPDAEANSNQMRQLFQNLIGNALKYKGSGKPFIRIYSGASSEEGFNEIYVEDNGIGFDEIFLDKIFKPFQRLHGRSSQYQGTGMGLAICRKIIDLHGGAITAKSEPGRGSTFIVKLPKRHSE
jgi:PAS domain S-box-containing protein